MRIETILMDVQIAFWCEFLYFRFFSISKETQNYVPIRPPHPTTPILLFGSAAPLQQEPTQVQHYILLVRNKWLGVAFKPLDLLVANITTEGQVQASEILKHITEIMATSTTRIKLPESTYASALGLWNHRP